MTRALRRFAIVGCGLTGTSMLYQLVEKLRRRMRERSESSVGLTVLVFEKQGVFGPGMPHNERFVLPLHITNMCAKEMSIRWGKPADFMNWVQGHTSFLMDRVGNPADAYACPDCRPDQCRHYPRAMMGEYLQDRLRTALRMARDLGIQIELHDHSEVVDLWEEQGCIKLAIRETEDPREGQFEVDGALLATGHWFPRVQSEKYFPSPWPASRLRESIPPGATVGVLGSSLSAIEVALTLTSEGRFVRRGDGALAFLPPRRPRRIVFHSRRGLLPRVRGKVGTRLNQYLTPARLKDVIARAPGRLTLMELFKLLDQELTAAYGVRTNWRRVVGWTDSAAQQLQKSLQVALQGDGGSGELLWQTVLFQVFPVVRQLYLNLSVSERKQFDRLYGTLFFMHAATQPAVNAEKLLALLNAGVVTLVQLGNDYQLEWSESLGRYIISYHDSRQQRCEYVYHYVVDARGQSRSLDTDPAPLTRNLTRHGYVQGDDVECAGPSSSFEAEQRGEIGDHAPHSTDTSICVDPATHRVMRRGMDGTLAPSDVLYAVGAMTRVQMIDASMAYASARSTARIADQLVERIFAAPDSSLGNRI